VFLAVCINSVLTSVWSAKILQSPPSLSIMATINFHRKLLPITVDLRHRMHHTGHKNMATQNNKTFEHNHSYTRYANLVSLTYLLFCKVKQSHHTKQLKYIFKNYYATRISDSFIALRATYCFNLYF